MRVGAISFLPTLLLSRTWAPTSALPHTLITRLSLQPNRLNYCFFLLNFVRHYSDHDQSISCPIFWQLLCYFVKVDSQPSSSQSVGVFKTEFELPSNLYIYTFGVAVVKHNSCGRCYNTWGWQLERSNNQKNINLKSCTLWRCTATQPSVHSWRL